MRKLIPVAVVLIALAGSHAGGKAPVPKTPTPPSLDGKYILLTTSSGTPSAKGKFAAAADPADGGGFGGPSGFSSRVTRGETVITKNEITIEARTPAGTATGAATTMEYTIDASKTPVAIDVETTSVKGKRGKSLGVIDVSGNRLTIALAKEGAERPRSTDEAEGVTVYYFQKAPPPPKVEFKIVAMSAGKEVDAEKELNKLAGEGYELVTTTQPTAANDKASVTTIHFVLKRSTKQP
jgi:uncharacterized protein (TIGR03067 family)